MPEQWALQLAQMNAMQITRKKIASQYPQDTCELIEDNNCKSHPQDTCEGT